MLASRVALGCHQALPPALRQTARTIAVQNRPAASAPARLAAGRLTLRVKRPPSRHQPPPAQSRPKTYHTASSTCQRTLLRQSSLSLHQSTLIQDRAYSTTTQNGVILTFV